MEEVKLFDFVKKNGQTKTAKQLNISQSGLRKALILKRNIILHVKDGVIQNALEIKPFPNLNNPKK